jgi:hypothetical protein
MLVVEENGELLASERQQPLFAQPLCNPIDRDWSEVGRIAKLL